jgi:hypothetical protein
VYAAAFYDVEEPGLVVHRLIALTRRAWARLGEVVLALRAACGAGFQRLVRLGLHE